jgi:hypothetical protein
MVRGRVRGEEGGAGAMGEEKGEVGWVSGATSVPPARWRWTRRRRSIASSAASVSEALLLLSSASKRESAAADEDEDEAAAAESVEETTAPSSSTPSKYADFDQHTHRGREGRGEEGEKIREGALTEGDGRPVWGCVGVCESVRVCGVWYVFIPSPLSLFLLPVQGCVGPSSECGRSSGSARFPVLLFHLLALHPPLLSLPSLLSLLSLSSLLPLLVVVGGVDDAEEARRAGGGRREGKRQRRRSRRRRGKGRRRLPLPRSQRLEEGVTSTSSSSHFRAFSLQSVDPPLLPPPSSASQFFASAPLPLLPLPLLSLVVVHAALEGGEDGGEGGGWGQRL